MMTKLLILSLSYLALLGSAEAVNYRALSYYGEVASGEVFRGQLISQSRIKTYVESLDVSPADISKVRHSFNCDKSNMKRFFKDAAGEVQDETIENFLSYFQQAKPEEQYALSLLVNKITEQLR